MKTQLLKIGFIVGNEGQIPGVPKNPRFIRDERFELLVQSIRETPEMMELREVIVYPDPTNLNNYVAIAGNMRLRACQELAWEKVPCKVLDAATPVGKLREIAIKDNVAFGDNDTDLLNAEWDMEELEHWGMEFPEMPDPEDEVEETPNENLKHRKWIRLGYSETLCQKVKDALKEHAETPELAVLKLLGIEE